MKAVLPRKDLLRLIGRCLPATAARDITPHSKSVLLSAETDPDSLRMCAVGDRLCVDTYIAATDIVPGSVAAEARRLLALAEAMPEKDSVTIAAAKDRLTVSSGRRRFSLPTMPADEFPRVPEMPENDTPYLIGSQALARVIETTRFAMDEGRDELKGVLLCLSPGQLDGYAFRGSCIARSTVQAQGVVVGETQLFVPDSAIASMLNMCKEGPNVACDTDGARLYVETEDTLVSGALPVTSAEWKTILINLKNIAQDPVCAIDGKTLLGALRAMLTADSQVCVRVEINAPQLSLSVPEGDRQKSGLDLVEHLELHAGAVSSAGVHAVMQADLLSHAVEPCEVVQLRITDELDPVCIRAADGSFMAIVMPMRR